MMDSGPIVEAARAALAVIIPIGAAYVVELLRRKVGVERLRRVQQELEAKRELATLAVKFAEQAFRDYGGDKKFLAAADWLTERARSLGLNVTEDEVEGLIESALREIKDALGEEWAARVTAGEGCACQTSR